MRKCFSKPVLVLQTDHPTWLLKTGLEQFGAIYPSHRAFLPPESGNACTRINCICTVLYYSRQVFLLKNSTTQQTLLRKLGGLHYRKCSVPAFETRESERWRSGRFISHMLLKTGYFVNISVFSGYFSVPDRPEVGQHLWAPFWCFSGLTKLCGSICGWNSS